MIHMLLDIFEGDSALGLKTSGMPRAREVSMRFVFEFFCIFRYLCGFTRVEKFGLAKGDGGEGEVAADEDHVGDAQGGQQVVEYIVHFFGRKITCFLCSLFFSEIFDSFHIF